MIKNRKVWSPISTTICAPRHPSPIPVLVQIKEWNAHELCSVRYLIHNLSDIVPILVDPLTMHRVMLYAPFEDTFVLHQPCFNVNYKSHILCQFEPVVTTTTDCNLCWLVQTYTHSKWFWVLETIMLNVLQFIPSLKGWLYISCNILHKAWLKQQPSILIDWIYLGLLLSQLLSASSLTFMLPYTVRDSFIHHSQLSLARYFHKTPLFP